MRVFALKSCDTCRKALRDLRAAGHEPQVIDIRADGLTDAQIDTILDRVGDKAVNRASTTWRQLSQADRTMPAAALIKQYPTLLKRPVIENGDSWSIGWKADAQAAHLP